jgi:hypothetical protein
VLASGSIHGKIVWIMAVIERRRALSIESSRWMVMTIAIGGVAVTAAGLFNTRRQVRKSLAERQAQISPIPEAEPEAEPAQDTNILGEVVIRPLPGGNTALTFSAYLASVDKPSDSEELA